MRCNIVNSSFFSKLMKACVKRLIKQILNFRTFYKIFQDTLPTLIHRQEKEQNRRGIYGRATECTKVLEENLPDPIQRRNVRAISLPIAPGNQNSCIWASRENQWRDYNFICPGKT